MNRKQVKRIKILYFGQEGCDYSRRAYEYLQSLGCDVRPIFCKSRGGKLPKSALSWRGDYILCLRSYYIFPRELLKRAAVAAINIHPATPDYPGSGSVNWALYDGVKEYGVTAHIMNEHVDNGPILECRRFPVSPKDTVDSLLAKAHRQAFQMLKTVAAGIASEGEAYIARKRKLAKQEKWKGKARRIVQVDRLQIVNPSCTKAELERVIRATRTNRFKPEIRLHGYRFLLQDEKS